MKNPVVPFLLIFAVGIGLIFYLSLYGLDMKKEIAGSEEGAPTESSAEFDAEAVAQGKCIGCHGGDLTGGMGGAAPSLVGTALSKDELKDVIKNGKGAMPPQGINDDAELDALADYILSLQ